MHSVCSKPTELSLHWWQEREESRTHRVRFIFSRFSSLLGPLPELLSMDPQSCWTARNMALCIIVLPPGLRLIVAGRAPALLIAGSGVGRGLKTQVPPPQVSYWPAAAGAGGGVSLA